jgi:hypothetical protein
MTIDWDKIKDQSQVVEQMEDEKRPKLIRQKTELSEYKDRLR